MLRTIAAYEWRTSLPVRAVAATPGCRPGLHSCARSTRDGVGGCRPAFGSDGSACDRAAAARFAYLLPAPSSDPPQATPKRPRRDPSGRRAGGQPGHEGQARELVPVEEIDVVISVKPERCRRCQYPMQGEDSQSERHQVTELPPIKPVVTEYQLHQLCCPACGEATRGELPVGVSSGVFGPRCKPSPPSVRGHIICRNARRRACWRTCLASR